MAVSNVFRSESFSGFFNQKKTVCRRGPVLFSIDGFDMMLFFFVPYEDIKTTLNSLFLLFFE
jgi:hypothetical protein